MYFILLDRWFRRKIETVIETDRAEAQDQPFPLGTHSINLIPTSSWSIQWEILFLDSASTRRSPPVSDRILLLYFMRATYLNIAFK